MPVPEQNKWKRGIGLSNVYYDVEVDELLGNAAAGIPPVGFTDSAPLKHADPATTTSAGEPISEIVPEIVAGIPILVNGVRYLIPLMPE
jgi:hypothetical protein